MLTKQSGGCKFALRLGLGANHAVWSLLVETKPANERLIEPFSSIYNLWHDARIGRLEYKSETPRAPSPRGFRLMHEDQGPRRDRSATR